MQVPIRISLTRKCKRCGLRYPQKESVCMHCTGLSDQEVEELKTRYKNEQKGNANLGRLLLYIAALILIGMIIFFLDEI